MYKLVIFHHVLCLIMTLSIFLFILMIHYGTGMWKFNNSLLQDEDHCIRIQNLIDRHVQFQQVFVSPQEFWDELKLSIKRETIKFSKAKRRKLSHEQVLITNRLIRLKNLLIQGDLSVRVEILELEVSLNTLFIKEIEGVKIQSRAKRLEEGEEGEEDKMPSSYFFQATTEENANMQIIVNEFLTEKIDLERGVRQGDSLSPMLYVLCVKVLACLIRNCPELEGFLLPGANGLQYEVGQYADDTTSFVKTTRSLHYLFEATSLYEQGSRAKLNQSKSEAM